MSRSAPNAPAAMPRRGSPVLVVPRGPWRPLLAAASLLVVLVSGFQLSTAPDGGPHWSMQVSVLCLLWLAVFAAGTYGQYRTPYLFVHAYVAAFVLFHLGVTVADAFAPLEGVRWGDGPLSPWLERAGWYTALALGSLGIGFACGMRVVEFRAHRRWTHPAAAVRGLDLMFWAGLGLLAASAVFLGIALATFGNLLAYTRVEFFHGVGDTRGLGAFLMVFPTALLMLVIGARTRARRWLAAGIALVGLMALLLSGYRSSAMFPLLAGAVLWVKTGRRIPLWVAGATLVGVAAAISIVGVLRAMGPYGSLDREAVDRAVEASSIEDVLQLGRTAGVLAHVLRLVPEHDPFRYGATYWDHLQRSIPNVLPEGEAKVRGRGAGLGAARDLAPGYWITFRVAPHKYARGEGIGFTAVGEPYLNFGAAGVVCFFALLGYGLARLDGINLLNHPRLLLWSGIAVWPLLQTVRNDFGVFSKPVLFMAIVLAIWWAGTLPFRRSRRPPTGAAMASARPGGGPARMPRVVNR